MTASPQWFGPPERPLFGWVHRPAADAARALVVVVPSLGQESVFAHHTLRSTADALAAAGSLVVRADLDGTGDSSGHLHDPGRVAAWLDGVDEAVALGRRHTAAPLVLLGFRLGALLAVEAAGRRSDVHGLVLWDAPSGGRRWLRELAVRHNVSVGGAPGGPSDGPADSSAGGSASGDGFAALGVHLTGETRADLARLDLRAHRVLPADTALLVEREERTGGPASTRAGRPVDRLVAADQDDLLARARVPADTRAAVVDWVTRALPDTTHPVTADVPAVTAIERDGVREHVTAVGPHRLVGIVTEPVGPSTGSPVVFVPDSITPHSGLSRMWTDLARAWAADGVRSLRFDLSGCGDSDARDGLPPQTIGALAHLDDTADAARAANPVDPADTVLVGLCSGAYLSAEVALALRPRGVVMINPVLSFVTAEERPEGRRQALVLTRRPWRRLLGRLAGRLAERLARTHRTPAFTDDPDFAWDRALEACFWQVWLDDVAPWVPDRVWRVLNRVFTTAPGVDRLLGRLRDGGTEVLVLAGDPDHRRATLGATRRLRRLERRGGLHVDHRPELDHALMRPGTTDLVDGALTPFVLGLTGGRTTARPTATAAHEVVS